MRLAIVCDGCPFTIHSVTIRVGSADKLACIIYMTWQVGAGVASGVSALNCLERETRAKLRQRY
jgi:hypothetical protein